MYNTSCILLQHHTAWCLLHQRRFSCALVPVSCHSRRGYESSSQEAYHVTLKKDSRGRWYTGSQRHAPNGLNTYGVHKIGSRIP
jgi:hypothetical protein